MPATVLFSVVAIELFERPVRLRLPFRFGAATLREMPQAFMRARIRLADGREAAGWSAELMVPKWFDKSPARSNAENVDDLRLALALAAQAYTSERRQRTAFAHAACHYGALMAAGARQRLNVLVIAFGAALADRAILDALCRARRLSFADAIRANLPGIDATLSPDLGDFSFDAFLAALHPAVDIAARHTVGLVDPLTAADVEERPMDGLPVTLNEVIDRYGPRYFKLKLCGTLRDDIERLAQIAVVLDTLPEYAVTLDGNEQFADVRAVAEFWRAFGADPRLMRLERATLYLEQPLPRHVALACDVRGLAKTKPLLIDESDATFDAFPVARKLGYAGVSSKNCKGPYKSLVNAARCAQWNAGGCDAPSFVSGEDLTAQAGLAVQQDLALVGLLGLTHVERNGHHYVAGFAGQHAPAREQSAFLAAHPNLYTGRAPDVRLAIHDGRIALSSLDIAGFGAAVAPDLDSLIAMPAGRTDLFLTGS